MPRHVESTLGNGWSPGGVGSALMTQAPGPGPFLAPEAPTQDSLPDLHSGQGWGLSCGHGDKQILTGRNHFPAYCHSL